MKRPEETYRFHCQIDDTPAEYMVNGMVESIRPLANTYIHIDLEVPNPHAEKDLRIKVSLSGEIYMLDCSWDHDSIAMFRDGNHLHFTPFSITDLAGNDYELEPGKKATLIIKLYREGEDILTDEVTIIGPWPATHSFYQGGTSLEDKLETLHNMPGLENLKQRIDDMVVRCRVNRARMEAGLPVLTPCIHTILIGGMGIGKSTFVEIMADIYMSLGLLSSNQVESFNLSSLQGESLTGGADKLADRIQETRGGVLLFENAHELYKPEYKINDSEPQIIRTLIDSLDSAKHRPGWMMVLTGFEEGMESLFAANPELKGFFSEPLYISNYRSVDLFRLIDPICNEYKFKITPDARKKLEMYIQHKQVHGGVGYQNSDLVRRVFEDQIIPSMFKRIDAKVGPTISEMETVEKEDIPELNSSAGEAMAQLDSLVGLSGLKKKINDYLNVIRLVNLRMEKGLPTKMPRLHMAFLGNPGTGKTTVAQIIGKIFASWGILSTGHVIRTEKSQMVGQYIGETEFKMRNLLARAHGNVLFIDEAYQLMVKDNEKDFGRIVMNSLLTELGNDESDMVVILAGYTAPMKQLLESNEGIESRFPNVFNFEDYTTDELVEIAHIMIKEQGLKLSDEAESNLRAIIDEEAKKPSPRFGNGRFVSNLIQNQILATMGSRLASVKDPTVEELVTILPQDVVIGKVHKDIVFDDVAIDGALERLDRLSGLDNVKKAIHNFVQSARYLHSIGEPFVGKGLLAWRFIGKSGTGKSTVAEIMATILKGMHLIANSNITQLKAERLLSVYPSGIGPILNDTVKKSCNGLIFIDADTSQMGISKNDYANFVETIKLKLEELTVEVGGECALIMAELDAPNKTVAEQFTDSGIYEFDHTLIFKDFTPDELYDILCDCLKRFKISFTPAAETHIKKYIATICSNYDANARTMKLMSRTIHQQVILRESGLTRRPKEHQVQLADIETFKWNSRKGRLGY
jgi:AAA+ superfamily predicted ATPase/energy-coupling factor transporter ATP-binding protein EcfA2